MDGIDTAGTGGAAPLRLATASTTPSATPVVPAATAQAAIARSSDLISLLADTAAPIDSKTVEAIKSLIASGSYPIDPHAIAAKMLAADFPGDGGDADA